MRDEGEPDRALVDLRGRGLVEDDVKVGRQPLPVRHQAFRGQWPDPAISEAEDAIKHDLGHLLLKLEELQAEHLAGARA